jgi:hypothetical protein
MGTYSEKARAWEDEKLDNYLDTLDKDEAEEEDCISVEESDTNIVKNIRKKAYELRKEMKLANNLGLNVGENSLMDYLFYEDDISFETIEIWKNF